ncbi:MAG: PH domain-containing protein [Ignisphaera sp.]|nr:PH domain-containing protein [Ignisphaera sp.]MCX8167557.1 PH domain-containing protein [Ignisphaera sp.]MDW8086024.1 PH domain-containing protein [Ignisphaera sp.]
MSEAFTIPIPTITLIIITVIPIAISTVLIITLALPVITLKIEVFQDRIEVWALPLYKFSAKRSDVVEVFIADLKVRIDITPVSRLYGHGLPSYAVGWFKLRNGAKAFLAVSSNNAVVFKLRDETYLVLTPMNMESFIGALKRMGWL